MASAKKTAPTNYNMIALAALLLLLSMVFLLNFRLFITDGPSMEPTYAEGTYLLSLRLHDAPAPGDVVLLQHKGIYCLKRVAFIAGDDVTLHGYEGYWGSSTVPEGYVYVLGDNRGESFDSRDPEFGLVAISDIWGKPLSQRENPNTTNMEE